MKLLGFHIKRKNVIRYITKPYDILRSYNEQKVFCIGLNKTGTTSLEKAMKDFGYLSGNQREAERLFDKWVKRDFRKLIRHCKTAVFFQDAPFSFPYTFIAMDQAFPGSKFILTIRDSPEQWYASSINFYSKLWGKENKPPTADELKEARYMYKGFPYHSHRHLHRVTDSDLYNKEILIDYYTTHVKNVKDYFRFRKDDLLVLNVADDDGFKKLTTFLNVKTDKNKFPWENRTDEK